LTGVNRSFVIVSILVLAILFSFGALPRAYAVTTGMTWEYSSISPGGTNTATITMAIGSFCPAGDHYSVIAAVVVDPNSIDHEDFSTSSPIACGSSTTTVVYPTDFDNSPITDVCGTYTSGFSIELVETSQTYTQGGDSFSVTGCPTGVPQFPIASLSSLMLIALLLPAIFIVSRKFRAIQSPLV
jgi:hypothetical protein